MKDKLDPQSLTTAKALANDFGDQLFDAKVSRQIQVNATALLHASVCYTQGLDLHTTLEAIIAMYKQMEERMGKL